jgi:hypothetical protein
MQSNLRGRQKLAFVCYLLQLPPLFAFGVIYLTRSTFMPYHAIAVGQSWVEVDPAFQILILALMRVAGGGFLAAAGAMAILLFKPFRQGRWWAYWAIPVIGLFSNLSSLYATAYVTWNTPASPPWIAAGLGVLLLCIGFILSWPSMVKEKREKSDNGA